MPFSRPFYLITLLLASRLLMSISNASTRDYQLPANFKFCVSTAAHQVEGANFNSDWWEWEQTPGHIKHGDTSRVATDSWNHQAEDIANMSLLGVDTHRFSVEWAKIEPKDGEFNDIELDRYIDQIDKLKARNIDSMVTLYHFTLPLWVSKQGGWEWDGIPQAFDRFAAHVASRVGSRVSLWITLNEPMTIIGAGYVSNVFPPAKNDFRSAGLPMANMIRAHALAYHSLHRILDQPNFKPRVGLAHHLRNFDPRQRFNPLDHFAAREMNRVFNWAIPTALKTGVLRFRIPFLARATYFIPEAIDTQDFFGINYYSRDRISVALFRDPPLVRSVTNGCEVTDLDWEIYPEGLDRLLTQIRYEFPKMPIWITENGLADRSDKLRMPYIEAHLKVIAQQIQQGAPIEGYCHWTLNDNFEWAEGYAASFGLYSVDPHTQKRLARPSAKAFSELIHSVRK